MDELYTIVGESTKQSEFESGQSVLRFKIDVNNDLINKYANILSTNERIALTKDEGKLRGKALQLHMYEFFLTNN